MKKNKNKIIAGVVISVVLVFAFWYGGDAPSLRVWAPQSEKTVDVVQNDEPAKGKITESTQSTDKINNRPEIENNKAECSEEYEMVIKESKEKDKNRTEPAPEGNTFSVEGQDMIASVKELTCTLSVRCDTILNNISWIDSEKTDIVPKDGVIFEEKTVTFYEGESVFNLLVREMKRNKIHLEFENIPIYNSAYIEGIANIYEFDCGELSGWMYKVNDCFPNYGCSRYQLKAGDKVEWVYTCDLGVDVGGNYSARNGN